MKTVFDVLREKHPEPSKANLKYLVNNDNSETLPYHRFIFEEINASMVRKSAMKTHGSHGPSGLVTSFKLSSTDLCKTITKLAIRIATSHLIFVLPYKSCRLIAFDKCPDVRLIGITEFLMRIIGGTIVKCVKNKP